MTAPRQSDPFPDLPIDPDVADPGTRRRPGGHRGPRPTHLQLGLLALVLTGGAVGAPVRYLVGIAWTTPTDGFPWATFTINVVGAFALGLLLEALARSGDDTSVRRTLRLLVGTGMLGAFTTYSTLAVETDLLIRSHADRLAAVYALGSLAAGLLASAAGIVAAAGGHRALTTPVRSRDIVEESR